MIDSMNEDSIIVDSLCKRFGDIRAVDTISFRVRKGTIFALLGANGAGKSTTITMLTTALQPTSGVAQISGYTLGRDDTKIRQSLGVVFQQSLLDPLLTVRENLQVRATFYSVKDANARITELSRLIGLGDFIDRRYGKLSGGQRRRADIARALVHTPQLLFLDEPTTGLDPKSREDVWRTITDLQAKTSLTVFLTTHYMEEAERADMVCVLQKGKIIAHDTPQSLRATYAADTLTLMAKNNAQLLKKLQPATAILVKDTVVVRVASSHEALALLKRFGADIIDFEFRHGTMDDVFLALTDEKGEN